MSTSDPENYVDIDTCSESIQFTPIRDEKSAPASPIRRLSAQVLTREAEKVSESSDDHDIGSISVCPPTSSATEENTSVTVTVPVSVPASVDDEDLGKSVPKTMDENRPNPMYSISIPDTGQQKSELAAQTEEIVSNKSTEGDIPVPITKEIPEHQTALVPLPASCSVLRD